VAIIVIVRVVCHRCLLVIDSPHVANTTSKPINGAFARYTPSVKNLLDPGHWHWDLLALFGFLAQALFAARFLVQWIASERKRESHVPLAFWYLSLTGGILMTIYGVLRGDPVIVLGQAPGLVVYIRNLMLIRRRTPA
jgi:lipid-A-disaccharide synthase-like uncharacterized protein